MERTNEPERFTPSEWHLIVTAMYLYAGSTLENPPEAQKCRYAIADRLYQLEKTHQPILASIDFQQDVSTTEC